MKLFVYRQKINFSFLITLKKTFGVETHTSRKKCPLIILLNLSCYLKDNHNAYEDLNAFITCERFAGESTKQN